MPAKIKRSGNHEGADSPQVLVWDPAVRIAHWLLVLFFFVAYLTDDDWLSLHTLAGYGVTIYVVVRLIWGFVGLGHARFSDFAYGPLEAIRYLRDLISFRAKRYVGHSPAGGFMIFVVLFSLAVTTATGIALLAVEENAGPMAPWLGGEAVRTETAQGLDVPAASTRASVDKDDHEGEENHADNNHEEGEEALEEIHEVFSNLTLLLVILHIAGVVLASVAHKENLARAMITGRKRPE